MNSVRSAVMPWGLRLAVRNATRFANSACQGFRAKHRALARLVLGHEGAIRLLPRCAQDPLGIVGDRQPPRASAGDCAREAE